MPTAAPVFPQERLQHLERIVRAEFAGMPGMRLTGPQVRRLWSMTDEESQELLRRLTAAGFLIYGQDGCYCRGADTRPG